MFNQLNLNQELHKFPVPDGLEDADFVDLAREAGSRFTGQTILMRLEESETLSHGDNRVLVLRADELPSGSFKYLSGMNSVAESVDDGDTEFVVPSARSYLVAVGHGIQAFGGQATSFVPVGTNHSIQEAARELGLTVDESGGNFHETLAHAQAHAEQTGKKLLHPYASMANIAATGIMGAQIAEGSPDMTHLVLQFGGGSEASGVGSVVKQLRPDTHVTVAQAAGCSPFVDSVRSGEVRESEYMRRGDNRYLAKLGGVGVGWTHPLTLGITSQIVDAVTATTIDRIYATMYDYQQEHGVLPGIEAALGLDAARTLARKPGVKGATIVAILTGASQQTYLEGYLERTSYRRQQDGN